MADQKAKVNTPCLAYNRMAAKWTLIDDLLGGTEAMQARGVKWLPKFDKEEAKTYKQRLEGSLLYGAYADTVESIVSKPFSKPVSLKAELPENLQPFEQDVNGDGQNLTDFAAEIFEEGVNRGLTHILVDYPNMPEGLNLKEERESGARPRFIHVRPSQLIGWQYDRSGKLIQIRIKEIHVESNGEFGEQEVEYIRVITPTEWMLYRRTQAKGSKEDFQLDSQGAYSLGFIPLITCYLKKTGRLEGLPPMQKLAEVNLAHYRSDSDQRNILHYARVATLVLTGFTEEEGSKVVIGPNQKIRSDNPEAKVFYAEHSGKAIEAGQKDLDKLEERMVVLGLQPFMRRTGTETATGQSIDESRSNSDVHRWVRSLENALRQAFVYAAEWTSTSLPEDFGVDIYDDFEMSIRASQDIDNLLKARMAGELSRETFLSGLKKRAILPETLDVDEEIQRIEAEGPSLGAIGRDEEGNE